MGLKANTRIKFGVNLMKIQGVTCTCDFTHVAKSNFCHTYTINKPLLGII